MPAGGGLVASPQDRAKASHRDDLWGGRRVVMTGRRRFGWLRKLPSGRWQARYPGRSGRDITAPVTFATKGDAARWLVKVEADLARGRYFDPAAGQVTLQQWAEQWLARPGKGRTRWRGPPGSGRFYGQSRIPAPIGAHADARPGGGGFARSSGVGATLARDVAALRAALNAAVDADLIERFPARKVAPPRVRPPERELLSPDELLRLADARPGRYRALVLVGGVLGLRWGEAVALRACDVDFMRRTVTVAQVVEEIAGHLRVVPGEAKTTGSLRTLAAPPFLIDELARHLREHRPEAIADRLALVFVGPRGGILRRRFAERTFRPAVERAGLDPSLTFHGLRHVAISTLVDENVHPG